MTIVTDLLCESCGYEIGGLPDVSRCPECARPLTDSYPAHRTGSPWQQRRSTLSLIATNYRAIRGTRNLFDSVRIDIASGIGLFACNALLAGLLIVLPWSGVLIGDPVRHAAATAGRHWIRATLWVLPLQVLIVAAVLLALTLIEWFGIRAIARSRGWRLTPTAAWQVCAHASVGWVVTGLTMWVGMIASLNLAFFGLGSGRAGERLLWSAPIAGALLGLLVFELIVWTGLHRLRFANPPSSQLSASPA